MIFRNMMAILVAGVSLTAVAKASPGQCDDFSVGEARVISLESATSPTGSHYTVERSSEKLFTVYLNLEFSNQAADYRERINSCLEEVNRIGLGDASMNVHLKIFDPQKDRVPVPQLVKITASEALQRPSSTKYSLGMDCSEYVHEMLHLTGLKDEYRENSIAIVNTAQGLEYQAVDPSKGLPSAFDCRSTSTGIMSELMHQDITRPLYQTTALGSLTCGCPKAFTLEQCDLKVKTLIKSSHQAPLRDCGEIMESLGHEGIGEMKFPTGRDAESYTQIYNLEAYAPLNSPLKPAHIRHIIWPSCAARNQLYETCSINSIRTSKKHGGQGSLKVPKVCHEANSWLK